MGKPERMLFDLFRSKSRSEQRPSAPRNSESESTRRSRHRLERPRRQASSSVRRRSEHIQEHSDPITAEEDPDNLSIDAGSLELAKWPPRDFTPDDDLSQDQAKDLITVGAPIFGGSRVFIPHASEDYFALYATCEVVSAETDVAKFYNPAFSAMSFRTSGPGLASQPWETLEQPSLAFCYGNRPGTITLNHWTSLSGRLKPSIKLRDPSIRPREVELVTIIDRLIYLEDGFEEDHQELMYRNLYKRLLKDPDRYFNPHKTMERQIADLITILSGPQWIDFSDPRNQIVAKFFAGADFKDGERYKKFFHQLLLSMELDFRIHSKHHAESPKQKLLSQLPPCIAWDLALSRKWRECMSIEKMKEENGSQQIKFHLLVKKRQVKALRKFARAMKWPYLADVDAIVRSKDSGTRPLEERSSDAMAYFSGVILPGITMSFLLMNTLLDCDTHSNATSLTHMHPQSGFQYRSMTYWSSNCIVGKVLAPCCREIAGWIGPAMSTPDLERIQIARIRQRRPRQQISPKEVHSMTIRSEPLGPPSKSYPVKEYQLVLPDLEDIPDTVRIEKLALRLVANDDPSSENSTSASGVFDACVQFAVDGVSWPLRLSFDVSYIYAFPCTGGPHPLFYDYVYKAVKVDEILRIRDWGGLTGKGNSQVNAYESLKDEPVTGRDDNDVERVLVVEAFGVPDNEVLARAWASHWGLSTVIADPRMTCMACAVREAYAACLNVVILVEGSHPEFISDRDGPSN